MITRRQNWPTLLAAYIEANRRRPFEWAKHDCGTFVSDWVRIACGYDPLAAVRGRYRSARGWERVRVNDDYIDAADVMNRALGGHMTNPNFAHRGDLAAFWGVHGSTLGIVLGATVAAPGPLELAFVPRRLIYTAWSV